MVPSVEILIDKGLNVKGEAMLQAMRSAADRLLIEHVVTRDYRGDSPWLMLYGAGSPVKKPIFNHHLKKRGNHVIAWDLGYYGRDDRSSGYPMRMTIDAPHPQAMLSDSPDPSRWATAGIALRQDANKHGHIVLCGMGKKSRFQFGYEGMEWERAKLSQIRDAYPSARIIYRPKAGAVETVEKLVVVDCTRPIEQVIFGARLVVVRHSNCAVDACIAGVPVVCEDGAAAKLYGDDLCNPKNPSPEERLKFLQALAWWQWRPTESLQCWKHIERVLAPSA